MLHEVKTTEESVELIAYTQMNIPFDANLMPVLAARVSHAQDHKTGQNPENDAKLTTFLAKHSHTSPFEHLHATFRISSPIVVAREWMRHRTQSYNEMSMRYTSDFIGEVSFPKEWRAQDDKNRQVGLKPLGEAEQEAADVILTMAYRDAIRYYDMLLAQGVCREQAQYVIPVGHMTHFYVSANLLNWARFCKLRIAPDARQEIRELAEAVSEVLERIYPLPWTNLREHL